jgi:peroxiredoxin
MSRAAPRDIVLGSRVPDVDFGYLQAGQVRTIAAQKAFAHRRVIALGVPGAFTPTCTDLHIPDFIGNAERLKASGFDALICIAPNDPFVLKAWADGLDPTGRLLFLSDGNLDFATALGMAIHNRALFLGKRSERYLMIVEDGIIVRLRSEPDGILAASPYSRTGIAEVAFI